MNSNEQKKEHSLANHTKKETNTAASTVHERESSPIQMARQTRNHRSCLKHRPDEIYQHQHNDQLNVSPEENETDRLSAGGHHTTGRVSFAHAALNDPLFFQNSTVNIQLNNPDVIERKRRSALFAKKARELRLAELHYFKDHARDVEPTDE